MIAPRPFRSPAAARRYSYRELDAESDRLARGLVASGIGPGVRVMFMVTPGFEFLALAFALFRAGAVLVGIDPGMGRENLAQCLKEASPQAFVGIPLAHFLRKLLGWGKATIETSVSTAHRTSARSGVLSLTALRERGDASADALPEPAPEDPAIIAFTSGSTGVPKGVLYSHALLTAQLDSMRNTFGIEAGERELITFPHFAFFGAGMGVTLVPATMDFARPGRAIPSWIVRALRDYEITNLFGSPALLRRVGAYGTARGVKLPHLRRVVSAGAPVPATVVRQLTDMLDGGTFATPYGATESLPVTHITGQEILDETQALTEQGHGVCVGKPVDGIDLRIICISDDPIPTWSPDLEAEPGSVGEIAVSGPVVSMTYYGRSEQTALAKIADGDRFYHRMGDLGYLDPDGRLWVCGRKSQRVVTLSGNHYTVQVEGVFNQHPKVLRSALVGAREDGAHPRPVLCVELMPRVSARAWPTIRNELLALGAQYPTTTSVKVILRHRRFPVDSRHNAKIVREKLALWAERQLP